MSAPGAGAPALLKAVDLTFRYGKRPAALRGVSVGISRGEILGVMGPNGSGKTTLLRILAGSLRPSLGCVRRGEAPYGRGGTNGVAVMFDGAPFLDPLSGRENVRRLVSLRGWPVREAEAAAIRWMNRFGLADRADEPVAAYSFGMRRRLALAEVFAGSPDLMLLDEPTLGLDPAGRMTLIEVMREAAAGGAGAAVCSNDPGFVEAVADRVVLLNAGAEIAAGAPTRLIAELAAATILEVTLRVARPEASGASRVARAAESEEGWPEGICRLAGSGRVLRFSSRAGGAALPELCAELRARRLDVEGIRLHEPGLADVFASLSGTPLLPPDSEGGAPL